MVEKVLKATESAKGLLQRLQEQMEQLKLDGNNELWAVRAELQSANDKNANLQAEKELADHEADRQRRRAEVAERRADTAAVAAASQGQDRLQADTHRLQMEERVRVADQKLDAQIRTGQRLLAAKDHELGAQVAAHAAELSKALKWKSVFGVEQNKASKLSGDVRQLQLEVAQASAASDELCEQMGRLELEKKQLRLDLMDHDREVDEASELGSAVRELLKLLKDELLEERKAILENLKSLFTDKRNRAQFGEELGKVVRDLQKLLKDELEGNRTKNTLEALKLLFADKRSRARCVDGTCAFAATCTFTGRLA